MNDARELTVPEIFIAWISDKVDEEYDTIIMSILFTIIIIMRIVWLLVKRDIKLKCPLEERQRKRKDILHILVQ